MSFGERIYRIGGGIHLSFPSEFLACSMKFDDNDDDNNSFPSIDPSIKQLIHTNTNKPLFTVSVRQFIPFCMFVVQIKRFVQSSVGKKVKK